MNQQLTRREFLIGAAGAMAGLSGILALKQPPAVAAKPEISLLTWNHFVPASDEKLRQLAEQFSKERGIRVRIDGIAHRDLPNKLAAETQTKAGHDLVLLLNHSPALFRDQLLPVDDLCEELGRKYGGWWEFGREGCRHGGHWQAVPWYYNTFPGTYREDYFRQVGEGAPDTWQDLLRAGKKLKGVGHPIGFAIGQTNDANDALFSILWAYGARAVEADGRTIAINSPKTAEAIEYVKALYSECMEPEVLSWDDASNNRFILSGKGSWTLNPISIYLAAQKDLPEIAKVLNHHLPPAGPAGRFGTGILFSVGIWRFSKNPEAAKGFLRFLFEEQPYNAWLEAGGGFNHPLLKRFDQNPVWRRDPKLKVLIGYARWMHLHVWPAPSSDKTQLVDQLFIIPNMFAKAVTGTPTKVAMEWCEKELRRIYAG